MVSDNALMTLFSEYTGWLNFAASQQAESEVAEERADREIRRVEAQNLVLSNPKAGEVMKTKAASFLDPEVQDAYEVQMVAYARRKMTQVVCANCERCVFVVSRELSRRIGNVGYERRQMRWNP
jgi:hypothetical protein